MTSSAQIPRIALVHDWLTGMRGGEKVLDRICRLVGQADLFTLVNIPGACSGPILDRTIRASFLSRLPGVKKYYRHLLPLMPWAIQHMDASGYDLVISTSHCVANGIGGHRPGQARVCYSFTPMRYIWAVADDYHERLGASGLVLKALAPWLRKCDRRWASRIDLFLADSGCVAQRIKNAYGRESTVLYPPVDTDFYTPTGQKREDFYLVVSALAPYKKVEHAIEAATKLGRPLKVIGSGQMREKLRRIAGPKVELLGWQDNEVLRDHYRRCRALLFPQVEDFGIVPLEASACGAPVIAFAAGGALETVRNAADPHEKQATGLHYQFQTPDGLAAAIEAFEQLAGRFDEKVLRNWALEFSPQKFDEGFKRLLTPLLDEHNWSPPWHA